MPYKIIQQPSEIETRRFPSLSSRSSVPHSISRKMCRLLFSHLDKVGFHITYTKVAESSRPICPETSTELTAESSGRFESSCWKFLRLIVHERRTRSLGVTRVMLTTALTAERLTTDTDRCHTATRSRPRSFRPRRPIIIGVISVVGACVSPSPRVVAAACTVHDGPPETVTDRTVRSVLPLQLIIAKDSGLSCNRYGNR